ncbi:hypothetical protein KCK33_004500 [Salmonella enterica]|nr:hypothetical protein [Salmonella enterica]EGA0602500.1 hypothetical protein [Salmonella enterica]EHD2148098.1 hypothetical protein [Salmonella enterica]EHK2354320.1 hypothetical protein [Salmonella enterica]
MNNRLIKTIGYKLTAGMVAEEEFQLLVVISSLRSEKVINALKGYFVLGYTRKEVCERFNVNQGYLSIKIKEMHRLCQYILAFTQSVLNTSVRTHEIDNERYIQYRRVKQEHYNLFTLGKEL